MTIVDPQKAPHLYAYEGLARLQAPFRARFGGGVVQARRGTLGTLPLVQGTRMDLTLVLLEMRPAGGSRLWASRSAPEL